MIKIAESFKGFDFVRVDLMLADDIYLSELTHYPGSGIAKYEPIEFEYELGKNWKI